MGGVGSSVANTSNHTMRCIYFEDFKMIYIQKLDMNFYSYRLILMF